jgi:hypothetical protein
VAYILPESPLTRSALTEEECARLGGHCYVRLDQVLQSNPPQFPEICKHCKKGRVAIPQEPFTYRDWP